MNINEILSDGERQQLGQQKPGSKYRYVSETEWKKLRKILVEKTIKSNPLINDVSLIAYTPGETVRLLQHPEIQNWHEAVKNFVIPDEYKIIILVPCAKTKPWDEVHSTHSQLYQSYHRIIQKSRNLEIPPVYFATISEPLGIVPQEMWGSFPQYDNPGLFNDDFLRTGITTNKWNFFSDEKRVLPFDKEMYELSINILGKVVADFIVNNYQGRRIISFVDNESGPKSTHADMLDKALFLLSQKGNKYNIERFHKRRKSREAPLEYILSKISN